MYFLRIAMVGLMFPLADAVAFNSIDLNVFPAKEETAMWAQRYTVEQKDSETRVITWSRDPLDKVEMSGCRFVFLDIGANVGVHIREVFEAWKYPESGYGTLFDEHLGDPSFRNKSFEETGVCAFGFEANPSKVRRLKEIQEVYRAKGWRVQVFAPFVVSDSDGNVTLYGVGDNPDYNDWEANAVGPRHLADPTGVRERIFQKSETVVPAFSLDDWIRRNVLPHRDTIDYVLAKMDIEGSEYLVLKQMALPEGGLKPASLCQRQGIDSVTVEYHEQFGAVPKNCVLCTAEDIVKVVSEQDCGSDGKPSTLLDLDDETYLFDTQRLA